MTGILKKQQQQPATCFILRLMFPNKGQTRESRSCCLPPCRAFICEMHRKLRSQQFSQLVCLVAFSSDGHGEMKDHEERDCISSLQELSKILLKWFAWFPSHSRLRLYAFLPAPVLHFITSVLSDKNSSTPANYWKCKPDCFPAPPQHSAPAAAICLSLGGPGALCILRNGFHLRCWD